MAEEPREPPPCYDAQVFARLLRQTPTQIPACDDCIIFSWPWILELDVNRTLQGAAPAGRLKVLSVQHTWMVRHSGRWSLRRNASGGFNLVSPRDEEDLKRCAAGTEPAEPYFQPAPGQTLADVEREGEARYGPEPR